MGWDFFIYHSDENSDWIKEQAVYVQISTQRSIVLTLANHTIDHGGMNTVALTVPFWRQFNRQRILFVQSDAIICDRPNHNITDYVEWDYIGAPWDGRPWALLPGELLVGNGGFSFRNRDAMIYCIEYCQWRLDNGLSACPEKEDQVISYCLRMTSGGSAGRFKLAPVNIARHFSLESFPSLDFLGAHVLTAGGTRWNFWSLWPLSHSHLMAPKTGTNKEVAQTICELCPNIAKIVPGNCRDFSMVEEPTWGDELLKKFGLL